MTILNFSTGRYGSLIAVSLLLPGLAFPNLVARADDRKFAIAPLISSSPALGTGIGAMGSYLYNRDQSKPSQLILTGQYTDTDSFVVGGFNAMNYDNNTNKMVTGLFVGHVEHEFGEAEYDSDVGGLFHRQSWLVSDNLYLGLHAVYTDSSYTPTNDAGRDFLVTQGAEDENYTGIGLHLELDRRDNQFYPYSGSFSEANTYSYPDALGNDVNYHVLELQHTSYVPFEVHHVLALGYYGRYTSDDTPYFGQSYLGRRNALRGYTPGEIAGTGLSALQAEYRHFFSSRWKGVVFAGTSHVSGGNAEEQGRDDWYSSAGFGLRYAIQPEARVHLRVDVAFGNDESEGFYISIQEAF